MAGTRGLQLGLIGVGIVGGALQKWLSNHTQHKLKIFDPNKNFTDSLDTCDATFISVPVPTNQDGSQNHDILENAVSRARGVKFIRSTVLPGTNDNFGTYSCPEFLTERTAYEDTCKMDVLCGLDDHEFMSTIFHNKTINLMKNIECEIAKYAHNAMGAIKVNFFNLIFDICQKEKANYESVLSGVLMSGYINKMHTLTPGPDGSFGFGGACLPKDLKAFNYKYPRMTFAACMGENTVHRLKGKSDASL